MYRRRYDGAQVVSRRDTLARLYKGWASPYRRYRRSGSCDISAMNRKVTIYERADFAGEIGASISCAANGTKWLHEWGVDVQKGDPVVLRKSINRLGN